MNVIIIVNDCLRFDYIGYFGNKDVDTHYLDEIASKSVCFNNMIPSAPWTLPSTSSFITSQNANKLNLFDWDETFPDKKTMFDYFIEKGYKVSSLVFNPGVLFKNIPQANVVGHTRDVNNILNEIEKNKDEKFLMYVHHWWTHPPYELKDSAEEWRKLHYSLLDGLKTDYEKYKGFMIQRYIKSIEETSNVKLKQIIDKLKYLDILDDTLILFTADHGEGWGEREKDKKDITNSFALHGRYMYEEHIRTPLIMYNEKLFSNPKVIDSQIRTIDILPTLLDTFEISYDKEKFDGKSLLPLVKGDVSEKPEDRDGFLFTTDTKGNRVLNKKYTFACLRRYPLKIIKDLNTKEYQLFDVSKDKKEEENLFDENTTNKDYIELKNKLDSEIEKTDSNYIPSEEDDLSDEDKMKRRLKSLGYFD
jgi:arylsulfatase A-like enzyme